MQSRIENVDNRLSESVFKEIPEQVFLERAVGRTLWRKIEMSRTRIPPAGNASRRGSMVGEIDLLSRPYRKLDVSASDGIRQFEYIFRLEGN